MAVGFLTRSLHSSLESQIPANALKTYSTSLETNVSRSNYVPWYDGATVDNYLGGGRPQLMIFMLSGRDAFNYSRIKKSADCRWGVMSQCMQNAHVMRCQGQYISNVLMKVNAKLGGATARVASVRFFPLPGCTILTFFPEKSRWSFQDSHDYYWSRCVSCLSR